MQVVMLEVTCPTFLKAKGPVSSDQNPNIPLNPGLLVGKYMYTYLHIFMTQGIPYLLHQKKGGLHTAT